MAVPNWLPAMVSVVSVAPDIRSCWRVPLMVIPPLARSSSATTAGALLCAAMTAIACMHVCESACVGVCVCVWVRVRVWVCVCVCG